VWGGCIGCCPKANRTRRTPPTPDDASRMQYRHKTCATSWPLQNIVSLRGFIAQQCFLQTPPLLCNILHNITSYCTPPPNFEVFLRCLGVWRCFFLLFSGRIFFGWVEVSEKKSFSTRKRGNYCTLLCNTPLPTPLYCLQYCAIYFSHDPLYCSKILAISCKGQATSPGPGPIEYIYIYIYIYNNNL